MTLSIKKPFISIFKKSKSKPKPLEREREGAVQNADTITVHKKITNGKENLEEIYVLQYQIVDETMCRGASPEVRYEERSIKIGEDGVFMYHHDKLISHWTFNLIKEFSLDSNWIDWVLILRDGNKHYFKSYEALQIHLKMDEIIRVLVQNLKPN
ncbi:hypothetical protein CYY_005630 [Polysphondylium violaceum]|uniref:Uncharacterized protein n=1 Tax=Polysphondylium violaceum TaxID=133409 RepID=A0A8J4PT75_9MYCE|nr:hypothetical protein CYY_005630 [Polysphondylium violaceum]